MVKLRLCEDVLGESVGDTLDLLDEVRRGDEWSRPGVESVSNEVSY